MECAALSKQKKLLKSMFIKENAGSFDKKKRGKMSAWKNAILPFMLEQRERISEEWDSWCSNGFEIWEVLLTSFSSVVHYELKTSKKCLL